MNNFKVFLSVILFLLGLSFESMGQLQIHNDLVGEDLEMQNKRAKELQNMIRSGLVSHKSDGIVYVPVKFHLVADGNGNGRVLEHHVLEQLCLLNEAYLDYDIQFFMNDNELSYIDNNGVFRTPSGSGSEQRMNAMRDRDALNMFFTDEADSGSGGPGTTLGYYDPSRDWIVLRIDQINGGYNSTVGHEVGHFFSLLHPHNGWDQVPYDPGVHGNPAPAVSSSGTVPTECHDRSNCEDAGDYLCDTPEDYNFGFGWGDCNYTRNISDPCNEQVDPQEALFMGYFLDCPDFTYVMTDQQAEQMRADLETSDRNYLDNDFEPIATDLNIAYLLSPPGASMLPNNEFISFDWTDVDGANKYLLQVATGNTFSDNVIVYSEFFEDTYAVIDELPANDIMHWRVIPFNEYYSCPNFGEMQVDFFGTGVGTSNTEFLGDNLLTINQNVLTTSDELVLNVESKETNAFQWVISNTQGQSLLSGSLAINPAQEDYSITDLNSLTSGSYFISFNNGNGAATFKFVIL